MVLLLLLYLGLYGSASSMATSPSPSLWPGDWMLPNVLCRDEDAGVDAYGSCLMYGSCLICCCEGTLASRWATCGDAMLYR